MDLIIINGSILTMDEANPRAEAVAIREGKFAAAGTNEEILALRSGHTTLIDAGGKSVLPGFNDSHLHLVGYALSKNRVDISNLDSIEALQDRLRSHIRRLAPAKGSWIIGRGWDQTPYPNQRMPDRHDLDRVSTAYPMMMTRKCGHVCVLNTAGLKASALFDHPPLVEGGLIELDADGRPTGILKENAMDLVNIPSQSMSRDAVKALILSAAQDFVKAGLTSVQTDDLGAFAGAPPDLFNAYLELAAQGELPLRVNEQMLLAQPDELKQIIGLGWVTGRGNDYFKIGPLKLLTDGSFGGRSALLCEPYTDDPDNRGIALLTREQLKELTIMAHQAGMQVAAHAIGDQAIKDMLDIYKEAQDEYPRDDARFRIIHASLTPPALLDRFKEQGVLADVQPCFISSDLPFIKSRLGKARASDAYCFKGFLRRGIPMGGGSDCPVEDYRPLMGIHAAVNRQGDDGQPQEGWLPQQKLTLHEALYLYTMGSAYNSIEEDI
ncbi:MAG: amidohydrolase, partial [Clostridiales bacterium]|nr:amidohydrolase [Clostridiales bacterium]